MLLFANCRAPRFRLHDAYTGALGVLGGTNLSNRREMLRRWFFLTSSFPYEFCRDVRSNPRTSFRGIYQHSAPLITDGARSLGAMLHIDHKLTFNKSNRWCYGTEAMFTLSYLVCSWNKTSSSDMMMYFEKMYKIKTYFEVIEAILKSGSIEYSAKKCIGVWPVWCLRSPRKFRWQAHSVCVSTSVGTRSD